MADNATMVAIRTTLRHSRPLRALGRRATGRAVPLLLVLLGCGEGLPPIVGLDFSSHDRCTGTPPGDVDASASEIQCRVDDYVFSTLYNGVYVDMEQEMDVPGTPICCEVCAVADTADDVCESTCKYEMCSRARDAHVSVAQDLSDLSTCTVSDCGFDFEFCMDTNSLHVQAIVTEAAPQLYALEASCHAHAENTARDDGLFTYLEQLNGVPGATGDLADVGDVVAYCLDLQASDPTGTPTVTGESSSPLDDGADSTGGTGGNADTGNIPSGDSPPVPCGPHAVEHQWIRPTNNFGIWNEGRGGVLGLDAATHEATVTGGGIAFTLFPCGGALDADCIRLDRLSIQLTETGAGLAVRLNMLDDSELMPISDQGHFDVPPGALRLALRYEQDARQQRFITRNTAGIHAHIDTNTRTIRIEELGASSEEEPTHVILALEASLTNSQPRTAIVESRNPRDGSLLLTAETFDADLDPIAHYWIVPGIGSWRGDTIAPLLPDGRHAVILYADDVHRARGVAARWIDATRATVP
jgi:hypothetical protein